MSIARPLISRVATRFFRDSPCCMTRPSRYSTAPEVFNAVKRTPRLRGWRRVMQWSVATAALATLAACALPQQKLPPGTPVARVYSTLGQPRERYPLDNGVTRLLWPTQPFGETTTAVDIDASGKVVQVAQVLDNAYFYQAVPDKWTQQDVLSHFGQPVCKQYFQLSHRAAWSYRYMDAGVWYSMFVFLFDDNGVLKGTQKSPDPLHDPDRRFGFGELC